MEKGTEKSVAFFGGNGLRVELNSFDVEGFMADSHDVAIFGPGGDFKFRREGFFFDDKAVVAHKRSALADMAEKPAPVQVHFFGYAVLDEFGGDDFCSEGVANGLMPEADS